MSAVEQFEGVRPIARWDREPSAFWEAVTRITAELRYDPRSQVSRYAVTGPAFSGATKERLCQLVSQLPWLLPMLEERLKRSRAEGLVRIDYYQGIFRDACDLIDLERFRIDTRADLETRLQQADALSRAMLLKSELLLIVAQFDLLRGPRAGCDRAAATKSHTRLKAVA